MIPRFSHADGPRLVLAIAVAICLAGCAGMPSIETAGSLGSGATKDDGPKDVDALGERYRANPADPEAALRYAQALRTTGQRAQAVAVLEQASLHNPRNMELLGAYGRSLADAGNYQQALDVLGRAHTPDHPDWRILSAQGAVLDQMGRHEEARRYYETALKMVPDEPSILSNLGLSYALSKDLPRAEATLRRAAAGPRVDPRVRQNLALVVGLQGRFAEAETIARADLPPEEAAANAAYLRQMLSQQGTAQQGAAPTRRRVTAELRS
jgi:Flp pilus assembly protein TadD